MSEFDAARLGALCERLDLSPRHLLVAAARLAHGDNVAVTPARIREVLATKDAAAAGIADLLMTPIADFGHDEVDRAFAVLWPGATGA